MENTTNPTAETPAFGIAMFISMVLFIILLNQLPFPQDYGFWNLAGIFIGCCFIGGMIFGFAASVVNALYKVIIEVTVVLLMLFNVSYVSICWVFFDDILIAMDVPNKLFPIAILAGSLFIVDIICVLLLLPFARIAKSEVLDF